MIDLDYQTDRLVENLKKFNEYLEAINKALREESNDESTERTK